MKERNKKEQLQQAALIQQPLAVAVQKSPSEKNELAFEVGKFFLDLAKLTFAGVFLSGIMGMEIELIKLVISGAVAIGLLSMVGFLFVKRSIIYKK